MNYGSLERISASALKLILGILVAFCMAQAQDISGVINGTVRDSSGAAVPAAPVTLIHAGTGLKQTVATSSSGEFVLPSVPPGTYSIVVEAPEPCWIVGNCPASYR